MDNIRDFIGDKIKIDGRMIGCRIVNANHYLQLKNDWDDDEVEEFLEKSDVNYNIYEFINRILALKQSHWLLRRTSHSCGSLSDDIYYLKGELIKDLKEKYKYDFNENWVDDFNPDIEE